MIFKLFRQHPITPLSLEELVLVKGDLRIGTLSCMNDLEALSFVFNDFIDANASGFLKRVERRFFKLKHTFSG
jgi:hypothetical protein